MKRNKILSWISKIVYKKSTNYLRLSIITLIASVAIMTICLAMIRKQTKQIKDNFVNNDNTHIIAISGRYRNQHTDLVSGQYVEDISSVLDDTKYKGHYKIFAMYQLKFGFDTVELDDPINVFSIDELGEQYLLKDRQLEDGILYTEQALQNKNLTLLIPKIDLSENYVNIGDETEKVYLTDKIEKNAVFDVYDALGVPTFYVSYNTFSDIFKKCFDKELSNESIEEVSIIEPVYKVYLYVDNMEDVESIAHIINDNDYLTNFVFESFEDIGEALSTSLIIIFFVSIFLIVFTMANILISMKGYISLLAKDIGILKQMGYSDGELMRIYSTILNIVFVKIACVSTIIAVFIAGLILGMSDGVIISIYVVVINIFLILLDVMVNQVYLKKIVSKSVIELVKAQRTFE